MPLLNLLGKVIGGSGGAQVVNAGDTCQVGGTLSGGGSGLTGLTAPLCVYGDGSDGAVVYNSGGTVTLTVDLCATTILVTNSTRVNIAGRMMKARQSLQIDAGSSIRADGNAASGLTAGSGATAAQLGGGATGGNGRVGAGAGLVGSNAANSYGGAGGNGGSATAAGGNGGNVIAPSASLSRPRQLDSTAPGMLQGGGTQVLMGAGAGGGGGGSTAGSTSGGGGGGGGVIYLAAPTITNNGTISASGGAGAAGVAGNAGGGGGGGGGCRAAALSDFHWHSACCRRRIWRRRYWHRKPWCRWQRRKGVQSVMSAGILQNTTDTALVDMGATADYAALLFNRDTAYNVLCRLSGTDSATGDCLAATLTAGVEMKAGVLTMSPVASVLPYFAPAFPLAAITLAAGTDRIFVRVTGDVAYAGQVVDLDVQWAVWEEGI